MGKKARGGGFPTDPHTGLNSVQVDTFRQNRHTNRCKAAALLACICYNGYCLQVFTRSRTTDLPNVTEEQKPGRKCCVTLFVYELPNTWLVTIYGVVLCGINNNTAVRAAEKTKVLNCS